MDFPKLAAWLEQYKLVDNERHPDLAHLTKPDGVQCYGLTECKGCPHTAAHPTFEKGKFTAPAPLNRKARLKLLRTLNYFVHKLAHEARYMVGQPIQGQNDLINGEASHNFADFLDWFIVSATGDQLVLQAPEGIDVRNRVIYTYQFNSPDLGPNGLFKIQSSVNSVLWPGDEGEFGGESCMSGKSKPKLLQILAVNEALNQVTTRWNQDVSECMWPRFSNNPDPPFYGFRTWRQAGDREKWQQVRDPDPMPARLVENRRYTVASINALDPDGAVRLTGAGRDVCVADYHAPDPAAGLPFGTFRVTGRRADNPAVWDDLSSDAWNNRVQVLITDPAVPTYRSTLYFGATRWDGGAIADWRTTYTEFRVSYFYMDRTNPRYIAPCQARCKWSVIDHTKSAGNMRAPFGTSIDANGTHHFCRLLNYKTETPVIEDGIQVGVTISYAHPTGLEMYPKDGRCKLKNACNKYEEAGGVGGTYDVENSPFNSWITFGRWWKNINYGADWKLVQLMPGLSSYFNLRRGRVLHPSLKSLTGGTQDLDTPAGMHSQTRFPTFGGLGIGEHEIYTTEDGQHLRLKQEGAFEDAAADLDATIDLDDPETFPGEGHFPATVTGFKTKHDTLAYGSTAAGTALGDPDRALVLHPERSGYGNTKDTGVIAGRGVHEYSHATKDPEDVMIPAVDLLFPDPELEVEDPSQDRCDSVVTVYTDEDERPTLLGNEIGFIIQLKAIRQDGKTPRALATSSIHSIESLGNHRFRVQWAHGKHAYSIPTGTAGAMFDRVIEFYAGGTFVAIPSWAYENDYYSPDKLEGGQAHKCTKGDTVRIAYNVGGVDLTNVPLIVEEAEAVSGDMAETWGPDHAIRTFELNGYFTADAGFLFVRNDPVAGDLTGALTLPDAVAAFTQDADDTTIGFIPAIALKSGIKFRNRSTDERIVVGGGITYDPGNPATGVLLNVTRGVDGTTAAPISAGDHWEWLITESGTNDPLTRTVYNTRPNTLAADNFWIDAEAGRIYFGAVTGDQVFYYTSDDKDQTDTASCNGPNVYTVPTYAEFTTDLVFADITAKPKTLHYNTGALLTFVGGNPATKGEWTLVAAGDGKAVVRCHLDDAGRGVLLDVDLETVVEDPGLPVGFTGWSERIRKYDTTILVDESGRLEEAGLGVVGASGTAYCNDGVWYPTEDFKLYATQYKTDEYVEVPASDYIAEHGTGKIWVFESRRQALLTAYAGELACLKVTLNRLMHDARPSASMVNRVIDQVNSLSGILLGFGPADNPPLIDKSLTRDVGYLEGAYQVRYDAPAGHPNGYLPVKGAVQVEGVNRNRQRQYASQAWMDRAQILINIDANPGGPIALWYDYVDGYGYIDRSANSVSDYLPGAGENPQGFLLNVVKKIGGVWTAGSYYGSSEPSGGVVRFPLGAHGSVTLDGTTPENWVSGGHAVDTPGGPNSDFVFHTDYWHPNSSSLTSAGPGCGGIVQSSGIYLNKPFWGGSPTPFANIIGCSSPPRNEEGNWQPAVPQAEIGVIGAAGFGYNELMAKVSKWTTAEKVLLPIKVANLTRYSGTYSAFYDAELQQLVATGDSTETTSTDGVALIAAKIVDQTLGTMVWEVVANINVAGGIESDEWSVVDITPLMQALFTTYRNSRWVRFAFIPSVATEAVSVIAEGALAVLEAMMPDNTYACYVHPDNDSDWKDAGGNGSAPWPDRFDFNYVSSSSGSNVTWDGVQIEAPFIYRSYGEEEYGLEPPNFNPPPFH